MTPLLDLIGQHVDNAVVGRLSDRVGTEPDDTRRIVDAATPLLVGALTRNALKDDGEARDLARALAAHHSADLLDRFREEGDPVEAVRRGAVLDEKAADGEGILVHVFGHRRRSVEEGLAEATGVALRDVDGIFRLLAPLVMAALGRVTEERGLDATGLKALLEREGRSIHERAGGPEGGLLGFLDGDGVELKNDVAEFSRIFADESVVMV